MNINKIINTNKMSETEKAELSRTVACKYITLIKPNDKHIKVYAIWYDPKANTLYGRYRNWLGREEMHLFNMKDYNFYYNYVYDDADVYNDANVYDDAMNTNDFYI